MRTTDLLALNERGGNAFLLFLSPRRGEADGRPRIADLDTICQRVEEQLNRKLAAFNSPYLRSRRKVTVGFAVVFHNPLIMAERVVARLVGEAWESIRIKKMQADFQTRCRLQDVLLGSQITTVFQPIVDLQTGAVHGFEALSRGPAGTQQHSPINLFQAADETELELRARPALPPAGPAHGPGPARRPTACSSTSCRPRCTTRTSRARASSGSSRATASPRSGSCSR